MGRGEKQVLRHMQQNGGVITRSEALALGMASSTLHSWVGRGFLVAAGAGTYVQPGVLDREESTLRAATRALAAVVSHESAGRMHGLDGLDPMRMTVAVPVRRSNRFAGVQVHQLTDLLADETVVVEGLPVTDPPRTILDLAAVLPPVLLATCLDQMVRMKRTDYRTVAGRLESVARRGKPGVRKLRSLLEPRLGGHFVSDSVLETRLLKVLTDDGLPTPSTQYRPPWLRHMDGRVDLAYTREQVIVEGDSQRWHGAPEAFQTDRERDNLAQLAGWIILRFTWQDITKRPRYVVSTVARALSLRQDSNYVEAHP